MDKPSNLVASERLNARRLDKERQARLEAEAQLESKALELFQASEEIRRVSETLSVRIEELETERALTLHLARTDSLTGLLNRGAFVAALTDRLERAQLSGEGVTLFVIDLDRFKNLNDSLGHHAGDIALKSLAERTQASLRPGDMVARYGGEEFVLMLPNTPLDEAQQVLVRLQRSLSSALFNHEGKDVFVTFSAGVTLYRPGETLETALDRADVALYEAKHTGKNRACIAE